LRCFAARHRCETVFVVNEAATVHLRPPNAGDVETLARLHREFAAYYLELAPDDFRMPDEDGLHAFIEGELDGGADSFELVAELDGAVVGAVWARIESPHPDARHQVLPTIGETRLQIDYLVTGEAHRREGIGTKLVDAAEAWGRERGATVALTSTFAASPLSIPFWQERMGYRTRSVNLVKPLV
jgi:GNAT superfamily N-acetyltransferase